MPNQIEVTMHCQWCNATGHNDKLDKPGTWVSMQLAIEAIHFPGTPSGRSHNSKKVIYLCSPECAENFYSFITDLPMPSKELTLGF